MWNVGVLVFNGVDERSVSDVVAVFVAANTLVGAEGSSCSLLDVRLVSANAEQVGTTVGGTAVDDDLGSTSGFDVFWIPSGDVASIANDPDVTQHLRRVRSEASIIVGVGAGCVVLASAGLLRRSVGAEQAVAAAIGRLRPEVEVDSSAVYVDQGDLMTAPASSAADLALHMVARTGGRRLAKEVAGKVGLHWNEEAGDEVPPMAGEGLM